MSSLLADLRYALRSFRGARAATLAALLTLAVGIGAATAIYSVVSGVLLRSLPFREPERLVQVMYAPLKVRGQRPGGGTVPLAPLEAWRQVPAFADGAAYTALGSPILTGLGDAQRVTAWSVPSRFFPLLGVRPALGRAFLPEEDRPGAPATAILAHGFWTSHFGADPKVLGRTVTLDGTPYEIVGVMPPEMRFPEKAQLWTAIGFVPSEEKRASREKSFGWRMVARLAPGATVAQAIEQTDAVSRRLWETNPIFKRQEMVAAIDPLLDALVGTLRTPLLALLGAVAVVLLVACANVANLVLARAVARGREVALRRALGASPARVVRQALTESLLLALAGGALGVALAWVGVPALVALGARELPRADEIALDLRVLALALVATLGTGIAFGMAPALEALRHDPSEAMKEGGAAIGGRRRNRLAGGLVVAQVALTMVLLAGASLLAWSFARLTSADVGFRAERVLVAQFRLSGPRYASRDAILAFARSLEERARAIPGVGAAAVSTSAPLATGAIGSIAVDGREAKESDPWAVFSAATPEYLQVMGIPLTRGRALRAAGDSGAILVNERLAQVYFPGQDPIGKRVTYYGTRTGTIVGVVGDTREMSLVEAPWPQLFQPLEADAGAYLKLLVRAGCPETARSCDPAAVAPAVRRSLAALDPGIPMDKLETMRAMMSESVTRQRFYAVVLVVFAAVTLVMAAAGLYGTVSYGVALRTRELGLRIALGARPADALWLVVRRGLALALAGVALGAGGALAATKMLESLLYELKPGDPAALAAAGAVLALVAVAACLIPGREATRADPLVALRAE